VWWDLSEVLRDWSFGGGERKGVGERGNQCEGGQTMRRSSLVVVDL